jgi:hypothetical protein
MRLWARIRAVSGVYRRLWWVGIGKGFKGPCWGDLAALWLCAGVTSNKKPPWWVARGLSHLSPIIFL